MPLERRNRFRLRNILSDERGSHRERGCENGLSDVACLTAMPDSRATPDAAADPADEAQLVAGLRDNQADAFETLVRRYGGRMLPVARRILHDDDAAGEAVQEAFIAAFRAIGSFEGQSRLSTWLHRITVNAALMALRKQSRRRERPIETLLPRFLDDGHQADPPTEWQPRSPDAIESQETRETVRACIAALPETYRTVMMLRDIEGLDTQQTADVLKIEPGAVKVRLHRARQALRSLLEQAMRGQPV